VFERLKEDVRMFRMSQEADVSFSLYIYKETVV
jgi:hypothetical protein